MQGDHPRFTSTAGFVHAALKRELPRLSFDPAMPADRLAAWQKAVRDRLRQLMRLPKPPPQPAPRRLWRAQREGYELQKWEAYPEPGCVVPYLVLIPAGARERLPAVLCLPGSGYTKESLAGEPELDGARETGVAPHDRMAQWYVRAGMTAVAMDNPGVGETRDPHVTCDELSLYLLWMGRHYEGLCVSQRLPILRWLRRQPYVDPGRVAVSGHSLGAKAALILGLLDPSVAAVVWNDGVVRWRERAIACNLQAPFVNRQFVPGLIEWFDYPDLMAAFAPRPLLIPEGGRTRDIERVRQAYAMAGAPDNLAVSYYPRYAAPQSRVLDDQDLPEGLTDEEYLRYANIDPPDHWFKEEVAVPWLAQMLCLR